MTHDHPYLRPGEVYLKANVKAPRMAGIVVKIFAWLLELPLIGRTLLYFLKKNNLINKLITDEEFDEPPMCVPLHPFQELAEPEVKAIDSDMLPRHKVQQAVTCLPQEAHSSMSDDCHEPEFRHRTVMDYSRSYTSGEITPLMVAERFIAAVRESTTHPLRMSLFISCDADDVLKQAKDSTSRYQRGDQISVLDGVPIAIKDDIDCQPYPTTGGTKWLHKFRECRGDACCVARLRQCGAVIVGKTNMHELGAGTSGINPHYGATRNPYNKGRISGGSSSGSAAVVAAGLCPVALGDDGGGSVRIPAALCGVVGLKPTFGRITNSGVVPLSWTVGMVGILAATVEDAFIAYAAINGHDPLDKPIIPPPKLYFPMLMSAPSISRLKLAIYRDWFNDCSDEIRTCCSRAVDQLCRHYNWKTVEVMLPGIEAMRLAHYTTIGSECSASLSSYLKKIDYAEIGWDARVALSIYGSFSSKEYIKAQRMRSRQMQIHWKIFAKADIIVIPTTGVTAYPIFSDSLKTGELDYVNGAALVRYQIAGNFLGLPAVTVPVGYDKDGLPIGIQFIGKPWSEPTLIHVAYAMQALSIPGSRRPEVYYDLLRKD